VWVDEDFRRKIVPGIQRNPSQDVLNYVVSSLASVSLPQPLLPFSSGFLKARLVEKEPHPDSDHLFVCKVNVGTSTKQIVTNSTTVNVGDGVIVAIAGALLFDGSMMEVTSMLKQTTEGMLCSQKTLGIDPITQPGVFISSWPEEDLGKDYFFHE
jgi:tRNA-binding EMAP/Myf-like protein